MVANLDLPESAATYMHRVGRTGRFGTRGLAVTFTTEAELQQLTDYVKDVSGAEVTLILDGQVLSSWCERLAVWTMLAVAFWATGSDDQSYRVAAMLLY